MAEKIFVEGLFYKLPSDKAPKFIKANLSFNVVKFVEFLQAQQNERGWVNIDVKESREGKIYAEVNTWQAEKKDVPVIQEGQSFEEQMSAPAQEPTKSDDNNSIDIKDIPFA